MKQKIKVVCDINSYKGDDNKYHYFYKITNNISNKFYFGKHSTYNIYDGYRGSGTDLKIDYNRYDISTFTMTILDFFNTADEAYKKEERIVTKELVEDSNCYNINLGGSHGLIYHNSKTKDKLSKAHTGKKLSDETKNKISDALSGAPKPTRTKEHCDNISKSNKGKHRSDKIKQKMSENHVKYWEGKHRSDETKNKISDKLKGTFLGTSFEDRYGKIKSDEIKDKISLGNKGRVSSMKGKHHSEETKTKISNSHIGKHKTKEHCNNISKAKTGTTLTEEHKQKIKDNNSKYWEGKHRSDETKNKISKTLKGTKKPIIECPHCGKVGGLQQMKQWHFNNCKQSPNYKEPTKIKCPYCNKLGNPTPRFKQLHFDNCKNKEG